MCQGSQGKSNQQWWLQMPKQQQQIHQLETETKDNKPTNKKDPHQSLHSNKLKTS